MFTYQWMRKYHPPVIVKRGVDPARWDEFFDFKLVDQTLVREHYVWNGRAHVSTRETIGSLPEGLVRLELEPVILGEGYDLEGVDVVVTQATAEKLMGVWARARELEQLFWVYVNGDEIA